MPTDRSPSSGADDAGPGPIPDYESAIASLRQRVPPVGDAPRVPAAPRQSSGRPAPDPERASARAEAELRPARKPVGPRVALAAVVIAGIVAATILGLRGSGGGGPTLASPIERGRERVAPAAPGPRAAALRPPAAASPSAVGSPAPGAPPAGTAGLRPGPGAASTDVPSTRRLVASSDPSEPVALSPAERRALRRRLMRACEEERYAAGVQAGRRLREHDALDWGATLCFAAALRNVGAAAEAAATYRRFLERYPDNRYAKDAREALAELTGGSLGGAGSVRAR